MDFVVKPEGQVPSSETKLTANGIEEKPAPSDLPQEPASMSDTKMLGDEQMIDESKPVVPVVEATRPPNTGTAGGKRRRKDPPAKLSAKLEGSRNQTAPSEAAEHDPDFYQDWSGGSRYEVDNKPWNILGWLTEGFKNKLQRK